MLLIIARDAGRILMYSPRQLRHLAGTGRFPLLAQMRSADRVRRCLLLGVDRTYRGHHETDAIDPKRTSSLWACNSEASGRLASIISDAQTQSRSPACQSRPNLGECRSCRSNGR